MVKKYTFEKVKELFEESGCKLLENEYKNYSTKMRYICDCGSESTISLAGFKQGKRCRNCSFKRGVEKTKLKYEYVFNYIKENNCVLISKEYNRNNSPLVIKCHCGSTVEMTFTQFKRGKQCTICGTKKRSKDKHYMWIEDRNEAKNRIKFRKKFDKALRSSLEDSNLVKNNRTAIMLGYSSTELKNYIESHPNWNEICLTNWQIDHIFPIKAFMDYGIKDVKLINKLENLQPLSDHDNYVKGHKYDYLLFENWLISQRVDFIRPNIFNDAN